MRKVFLEDLPKVGKGEIAREGTINWVNCIGCNVRFVYDDTQGIVNIIGYEKESQRLTYLYNGKEFTQVTGSFIKAKLKYTVNMQNRSILCGKTCEDLTGDVYGGLTVIRFDEDKYNNDLQLYREGRIKSIRKHWICKCTCGKEVSMCYANLKSGNSKKCGKCYTFEDWCKDNDHQDYLDLWDYGLNDKKPSEIAYRTNESYWFKCKEGKHSSELWHINNSIRSNDTIMCRKCNSFGQWLIDACGDDAILKYWSDKNKKDPFEISRAHNGKVWIRCQEEGHPDFEVLCSTVLRSDYARMGCKVCLNREIIKGINDVATTHPHLVKYFSNIEDAYTHSSSEKTKIKFKCPDCGKEKLLCMYQVLNCGFGCSYCGDGVSYPQKFMISALNQLGIVFETEYSPDWINPKRYDFYISSKDLIIEMDGALGHGNGVHPKSKITSDESLKIDLYKDNEASIRGIHVIRIDCKSSDVKYISRSILNSNLCEYIDAQNINWLLCDEYATSNLVKRACDIWNSGIYTAKEIGEILKLDTTTIRRYLRKGKTFGWCDYSAKKGMNIALDKKYNSSPTKIQVEKDGNIIGIYRSMTWVANHSESIFGIKLNQPNICEAVNGKIESYKGMTFKRVNV